MLGLSCSGPQEWGGHLDPTRLVQQGRAVSRDPVRSEGRPTGHPGAHGGRSGPHGNAAQRHQTGRPHVTAVREAPPHWLAAGSSGRQEARLLSPWRPAVLWTVPGPPDPCPLAGALPLPASGEGAQLCHSAAGVRPTAGQSGLPFAAQSPLETTALPESLEGWMAKGWVVARMLLGWGTKEWPPGEGGYLNDVVVGDTGVAPGVGS